MSDEENHDESEDILALIDGIESALAADVQAVSADADHAASHDAPEEDLPAALRPARIPDEALPSEGVTRSSVRPVGYARADSFPPPRRLDPVPMPRRVYLDPAPRSAGPIPRIFGSTRDILAKFRWGA